MPDLSRPARLKTRVENGRPSRPRVYCGWQDRGTLVAWVGVKGASFAFDEGAGYPHGHEVQWASGFRRGEDQVVRLSRRATARWRRAKRQGVRWNQFVDRGGVRQRRPYVTPQQRWSARPDSAEPGGSFVAPDGSWDAPPARSVPRSTSTSSSSEATSRSGSRRRSSTPPRRRSTPSRVSGTGRPRASRPPVWVTMVHCSAPARWASVAFVARAHEDCIGRSRGTMPL